MNEPKEWLHDLAERLRELHDASGQSGKDLAEALGWPESKVSRVRRGVTSPSADDLAAWVAATGAADAADELNELLLDSRRRRTDFAQRMARGQAEVQRDYNRFVEESPIVRHFETVWVPGLLQTREYARAVFSEMLDLHDLDINDVDETVLTRMRRQQYLHDPDKRFEFLLAEPVLYWDCFTAEVMVPQLNFLLTWLDAPNVRFGILPMRGGNRRVPQNSFQMYGDHVIVEVFDGEIDRDRPELYVRVMDEMWEAAAEGKAARPVILKAIETWERDGT